MKIGIICSNNFVINKDTHKGTEAFSFTLVRELMKNKKNDIVVFASGNSDFPKIESISEKSSSQDEEIEKSGKHIIFELALISKALSMENKFDLFHANIGDGDIVLPFAGFIKKPVLITLHNSQNESFSKKYFSLFKDVGNVYFVSVSNAQRKLLPDLRYAGTIHHGIDTGVYTFNPHGGDFVMWAGRAIPEKGIDDFLEVIKRTGRKGKLFPLRKPEYSDWLNSVIDRYSAELEKVTIEHDKERMGLVKYYQEAKIFAFPIKWEEPFGLVLIEAMSCGTPIVAFAKGSVPEIVEDGKTGFIVNPSGNDIRGDFIIKKTGIEGFCEAINKIYSMSEDEYRKMRENCRLHIERNFSSEKMAGKYEDLYKKITSV